jgi:hypothetical protein
MACRSVLTVHTHRWQNQRMQFSALVRSTETKTVTVEADTYAAGKAKLEAELPEGWQIQAIRQEG